MKTCLAKFFTDGGRTENRCQEDPNPETSCVRCKKGWCDLHSEHVELEEVDGVGLCCDNCVDDAKAKCDGCGFPYSFHQNPAAVRQIQGVCKDFHNKVGERSAILLTKKS